MAIEKLRGALKVAPLAVAMTLTGCSSVGNILNPFYDPPPPVAYAGELNDRAISGEPEKAERARSALEHMASYQRAHYPQPVHPVVQPAVVRLMWIPDHLNKNGDLVPAHYYYLKVLKDRFAVSDSFELEGQLGSTKDGTAIPYVYPK